VLVAQPASNEIGEQVGDDDGVLGVAEDQSDGHLRAVGGDDEGDGDHLIGDVESVDHQHRRVQAGQVAGQQVGQRRVGGGLEPA
jgi:hypothetical protein